MRTRQLFLLATATVWACNQTPDDNPFDGAAGSTSTTDPSASGNTPSPTTAVDGTGTEASGAATTTADSSGGGEGPIFDVSVDDIPIPVDCNCGNDDWSYIWVANANQGTVSKINTETMVEEGRYLTRPDGAGNPSRTSVSVNARSVAVANRYGGLVRIWARDQFCDPMANGQAGLQTSTGAGDVLPWGEDDCISWYTPFPTLTTQRPVAWSGVVDAANCEDEAVWTAGCGGGFSPGFGSGNTEVFRLDGSDGTIIDSLVVPNYPCAAFGPYGGAIDPAGDFWIVHNGGDVAVIRADTLDSEVFSRPGDLQPYGITADADGYIWVSGYNEPNGIGRLDPSTGQWDVIAGSVGQGGVTQTSDGRIWTAYWSSSFHDDQGVVWFDPTTLTLGGSISVPGGTVKGVSADLNGFLWAVTGTAHKIDLSTDTIVDNYAGLSGPYTYSDMTGAGLQNVACDPAG
ncbi:MAG: hypothetical protein AAF799_07850 [Myxococcota bacterium]